jgi:hypothetical protein
MEKVNGKKRRTISDDDFGTASVGYGSEVYCYHKGSRSVSHPASEEEGREEAFGKDKTEENALYSSRSLLGV